MAEEGNESFFVYGEEEGEKRGYDDITYLMNISDKVVYIAEKEGKQLVVYDGEEGKSYDEVKYLTEFKGRLADVAKERSKYLVVQEQ